MDRDRFDPWTPYHYLYPNRLTFILPAILRETSGGTSYLMSRLVFRHYAQFSRTICTSIPQRTSTKVSFGFILIMRRSPSFGSRQTGSSSTINGRLNLRFRVVYVLRSFALTMPQKGIIMLNPSTCQWVELLSPCFKTGHTRKNRVHIFKSIQIYNLKTLDTTPFSIDL